MTTEPDWHRVLRIFLRISIAGTGIVKALMNHSNQKTAHCRNTSDQPEQSEIAHRLIPIPPKWVMISKRGAAGTATTTPISESMNENTTHTVHASQTSHARIKPLPSRIPLSHSPSPSFASSNTPLRSHPFSAIIIHINLIHPFTFVIKIMPISHGRMAMLIRNRSHEPVAISTE